MCDPAEQFYAPQLYKTLRGLQAYIEGIVGGFVQPDVAYGGTSDIHNYSVAQCFTDCGINSGTSTVTKTATTTTSGTTTVTNSTYYFDVANAYFGQPIYWDAINGGKRKGSGQTTSDASNGRIVVGTASTTNDADLAAQDAIWMGASIVYSAGWTRYHPLEFTHLYGSTGFIPDIKPPTDPLGSPTVLYPPAVDDFCCLKDDPPAEVCCKDCFGVGQWIHRDPSMGFKTYDAYGYAINGGGNTFVAGDVVRYAGDVWHDPGTDQRREIGDDVLDLPFWDRFGEFRHPRDTDTVLEAAKRGIASAGTKNSITDSTKNWWANWYGGGTGKVHSDVAAGGSATTLALTTDYANTSSPAQCWWASTRFIGEIFTAPFVTFTLEVDKVTTKDDVSTTITFKTPITGVTGLDVDQGNQPVIHFAAQDGLTVAAGDVWRIREPGTNLNRYRDRRLIVTPPAGDPVEVTITHNDDATLFFAARATAFPVGSTYQIVEYTPGGVWQFATSKPTDGRAWQKIGEGKYWVQPVGADARGKPFHPNQTENLPHKAPKQYGHVLKGDYIYFDTFSELYLMLNRLRWTVTGVGWTNDPTDSGMPTPNHYEIHAFDPADQDGPTDWHSVQISYQEAIDDPEFYGAAPTAVSGSPSMLCQAVSAPTATSINIEQTIAAARVTKPATLLASSVDIMAFGDLAGYPEASHAEDVPSHDSNGPRPDVLNVTSTVFNPGAMSLAYHEFAAVASFPASKDRVLTTGLLNGPLQYFDIEPIALYGEPYKGVYCGISGNTIGFNIVNTVAILKWDVPGGLRFTP